MMFDRLDTDAEFGGDLLVSPTMHAVHHEDTSGLGRHGTNHPPIEVEHVHRLDPQSLIGAGRAIAPEKETVGCDTIPRLAARPIDREVAGDPGKIGARVLDRKSTRLNSSH